MDILVPDPAPLDVEAVRLATSILPPWPSMNCFEMKRPMPVPMVPRVV